MTFNPDQIFANFKIIRKLGEGGMGEVYLAEDQKLGREVALKILQADFFDDKDKQDRFYREARTAARISHPNVMGIHDLGSAKADDDSEEISYIVMEYIEGKSLRDYLADGKATLTDRLRIAEKIARGLAEAHKLNIVHRDIKADNIIIKDDGEPKILDFGLAKPTSAPMQGKADDGTATVSQELTQEGKIVGTVTYMSPEQARGDKVDSRSDIFSFGILLYKMFSGEFPFDGPDRVSTIAKILEAPHEPIRRKEGTLPAELERIVDKCLQKSPDYRYQDTRDLAVDIRSLRRQFESGISDTESLVMDRPDGAKGGKIKTKTINIPSLLAGLAVIAAAIIWTVFFTGGSGGGSSTLYARQNALAILGFENKTGDQELDWLQAGLPEILLTDLAQGGSSNLIGRNRVLDCLDDDLKNMTEMQMHSECIDAAKSLGATKILSGSFYKLGEKIRIDARLEDIETGQIILGEKVVGDDPFALVDSLTHKIGLLLNLKDIGSGDREVATITSSSPDAYKQYILGMEKYNLAQYEESIEYFDNAVKIDSTFALPYLRAGMALFFQGQVGNSAPYLKKAEQFADKLPRKDRELLDFYNDVFLYGNFNDAYVKLTQFVKNYPDDKEARAIYAIILYQVSREPSQAKAQLDTVLMLDPRFLPALDNYVEILSDEKNNDSAIEIAQKIIDYYPNTYVGYLTAASLYATTGRPEKAIEIGTDYLKNHPDFRNMLTVVTNAYIRTRDFKNAQKYSDQIKQYYSDDPFNMYRYYSLSIRLALWQGRLDSAYELHHKRIESALATKDDATIFGAYNGISDFFLEFEMPDSAIFYAEKLPDHAIRFQHLNYPLKIVDADYSRREEAKEYFDNALDTFKTQVPPELWTFGDEIKRVFYGYYNADTSAIIDGFVSLTNQPMQGETSLYWEAGRFSVMSGKYQQGIDYLKKVTGGIDETSSPTIFITSQYYLGIAYEALGQTDKAISSYREVMRYWDTPDMKTELMKDCRERFSRLAS